VLYLLHGSNDTAAGWTDIGKANFILDNLIAQKKAVPMIIVMPWGHALPFDGPQGQNNAVFEQYVLKELIPSVEKKYRVAAGRENRAIAGLSMGGGQTLQIGWDHLELFSAIGAFSFVVPRDFENTYKTALDDPAGTNARLKLLWLGVGSDDNMMYDNDHNYAAMLTTHKINNSIHETPGRHQYAVWRWCLCQVAPLLFQDNAKSGDARK
jgi:enterochelin esterase family protein